MNHSPFCWRCGAAERSAADTPVGPFQLCRIVAASVEAASGTARCPRAALFFGITLLGIRDKASFTTANKLAFKQTLLRLAPSAWLPPVLAAGTPGAHPAVGSSGSPCLHAGGSLPLGRSPAHHGVHTSRPWQPAVANALYRTMPSPYAARCTADRHPPPHAWQASHARPPPSTCRPAEATFLPVAIGPEDTGQVVHTIALFPGSVREGVAAAQALAQKLRSGAFIPTFDQRRFGRVHLEVCSAPFLVRGAAGREVPLLRVGR